MLELSKQTNKYSRNKPGLGFVRSSRVNHAEAELVTLDFAEHLSERHEEPLQLRVVAAVKQSVHYFASPTSFVAQPSC